MIGQAHSSGSPAAAAAEVLILTGPPGSGKTTAAGAFAARRDRPGVHLHADDFWRFIRSGAVPPWLSTARRQNEVVMNVIARAAEGYARGGYFVVVDGIVGPWLLAPFRRIGGIRLDYVVLRPTLAEAIARCRRRGGDTLTAPGPIADLHRQFSRLGELERHALDIAGLAPEATRAAIDAALASGRFRLGE